MHTTSLRWFLLLRGQFAYCYDIMETSVMIAESLLNGNESQASDTDVNLDWELGVVSELRK